MNCYHCGSNLTEHSFCTNCRADVGRYKLVISASNMLYNDGLEKARVRDLSGAIASLRQCLKLNKNHVDARNLLGLIYFEIGESVQALNEWVISKNLRSKKNVADDYLDLLQNNPGKLEALNATLKKYNQALAYCYQDSLDLAVIQLKKVLSMNSKYLQAHQLLALLYMAGEEWGKARKELERSLRIDRGNTLTLRYLQIVDQVLGGEEAESRGSSGKSGGKKKNISDGSYQYRSGNETIIQPYHTVEGKSKGSVWNLLIGLVIGVGIVWFLILPAQIQNAKSGINEELKAVSEQLDVKTATINELESSVKKLETEKFDLESQLEDFIGTDGTLEDVDHLLQAAGVYLEDPENVTAVAEHLDRIDRENIGPETSESFIQVYDQLLGEIGPLVATEYYREGMTAYNAGDYEEAIRNLIQAFSYDETNAEALFNLGNAYRKQEMNAEAIQIYEQVIELFPGTDRANRSQSYLNELEEAQ